MNLAGKNTDRRLNANKLLGCKCSGRFYSKLQKFAETTDLEIVLATDSVDNVPTVGFIVQPDCDLPVVPAYKMTIRRNDPVGGRISHWAHGFVAKSYLDRLPGRITLTQKWAQQNRTDLLMMVHLFNGVDVYDRRFSPLRLKDFTPTRGAYGPGNVENLRIAFLWAYWERQGVKWSARADDAVRFGIYSQMKEDNFRRICAKIGLLQANKRGGSVTK